MKLLGITIGTLVVAALIWSTLHFWGKGLQYEPYNHPLMKPDITRMGLQTADFRAGESFVKSNPNSVLYLKIYMSADGVFFTLPKRDFNFINEISKSHPDKYKGNKHYYYDFSFIKERVPHVITLDDWTSLRPDIWIFDLQDNALDIDKNFATWFEKNNFQNLAIIRSDVDLIISSLKEKHPLWIYGSTLSDLNKLLTLASIHLEGIANFQRDYYFSPVTLNGRSMINPDVLTEMRKRHKKIAIGPVLSNDEHNIANNLKPDILIIQDSASD